MTSQKVSFQRRQDIFNYLDTSPEKRKMTQNEFRKDIHISYPHFATIKEEWKANKRGEGQEERKESGIRNIMEGELADKMEDSLEAEELERDPTAWWKKQSLKLNQAILSSASRGNAQSQKLAKQLSGEFIEKREDTLKFEPSTADYINWGRQLLEELRQDWQENGGTCQVCSRPQVLLEEVRMDSEQEHREED